MSKTLDQIYISNPTTTMIATDLLYLVHAPYTPGTDSGIAYSSFLADILVNAVHSIQGTANEVLVNGTSGSIVTGTDITLSTPQPIGPTSSPTFNALTLTTALPITSGGTGVASVTTAPTATAFAGWNANKNLSANNFIPGYATTVTAAATTELTVASAQEQYFTGTTTQIALLPVTSTLVLGFPLWLYNNSTGNVTVNASDGSLIQLMTPNTVLIINCTSISVTSNMAWNVDYVLNSLSPSQSSGNVVITGGNSVDSPLYSLIYQSYFINNIFYQNLLTSYFGSPSILGPTTVNFGNIQGLVGAFNPVWQNTTSISFPSLIYCSSSIVLATPLLTSFSAPNLAQVNASITLTSTLLTTFSLPALVNMGGGLTFTLSPSLATVNLPLVINLFSGISGTLPALTSLTLTNVLNIGNIGSNPIPGSYALTANALTTLSLPALITIATNFAPVGTSLATISMPSLVTVGGTFSPTLAALTSLTVTNLATVNGAFAPTFATLTTWNFPALATLGASFAPVGALATTVTLTSLATVATSVAMSFAALTTLSLPALVSVRTTFAITAANLVTFSMGSTLKSIGGNFTMTGMNLNQASVDGILVSLAALDGTNGTTAYSSKTVNLSGGTSSAPSATGLAAKVTLNARSVTVTTN